MNLKRIELRGFKSFADRTAIDFLDGVTCIVGPNGCGKSNIIDSIRWVLGEQRTGALRARRMEDVIFSGTQHRDPLNYAEVNLIFDNAEGFFDQGLKEMSLKRVLHRSGESNYYINGQVVRLKDVRELLMDSGIGVSGYSLISQGDIEDILRDNKFNRRKIFEEASGISLFNHKKEEAQRRLLKVKDHLLRLQDIFGEIDARLEPLKEAADKARQYIRLRDELKRLEIHFGLIDYDRYKAELLTLEREIKRLRSDLEEVSRLRSERLELKSELEEQLALLESERELLRDTIRLEVEVRDELAVLVRVNEEKIRQTDRRLSELDQTRLRHEETILARQQEADGLSDQLKIAQTTHQETAEALASLEAEISALRRELHLSGKSKEELSELIGELRLEQERIKSSLSMLEEQQAERLSSRQSMAHEAKLLKIDRRKQEDDGLAFEEELAEAQTGLAGLDGDIHQIRHLRRQIEEQVETINEELRELDVERRLSEDRIRLLDTLADSAQQAISQSLMEQNIDLKGQLIEHLKIKKGYEKAIEASLGRAFYDQLLRDVDQVASVMDYLRGKDLPQMGFLVPSLIRDKQIEVPGDAGVLGIASDFVTGAGEGFAAIQKLLQNTIVTRDMATALNLETTATIVTLAGESIKPSGAVTSAKSESRALNLLEERDRLADVVARIADKTAKLEPLQQALDADEADQADRLRALEDERQTILERIERIRQQKTESEQAGAMLLFQERQLQESMSVADSQLADFAKRREAILGRLKDITAQEKQALAEQQPVAESGQKARYDELLDQQLKLRLKQARSEEETSQVRSRADEAKARLEGEQASLSRLQQQYTALQNERQDQQQEADRLQEELSAKKMALSELDARAAGYQEQIGRIRQSIRDLDELILTQDDANQSKRDALTQKEIQFTRNEERQNAISDDLWEKYELSILQLRDFVKDDDITQSRSAMKKLRLSMIALEPVHLGAIEEYAELSERHGFLDKQMGDLRASEKDIQHTIRTLEARMKEDFRQTFDRIRDNYQQIFTELFQGGHGDIQLDEPDNILESDIIILASPPGKKLQHMNLLSGGEKALTAIALLFSVLKAKPAPFYVLDEIEAALDDINIQRFGRFLEEFSKGSQFILITHRKGTMEFAKALYGVSMEEKGISKTVSLELVS
ncbi:MAG TPA: chromosome segregation protein SMC [Tissierellia bacterium]|nr:chromosome segregation protein SMC [Tissierellia bacterium]